MTVAMQQKTAKINSIMARFGCQDPVLVSSEHIEEFMAHMQGLASNENMMEAMNSDYSDDDDYWFPEDDYRSRYQPYKVTDGTLMIPIKGMLMHDFNWQFGSYATGYDYIWKCYERGMDDAEVNRIGMMFHSPGGDVAGNFDLVDKMYARRNEKPLEAFISEGAYSAAYSIASVAPKISITRTGGAGSIGVLTMHMDQTKMLEMVGLKVTMVSAPKNGFKTETQPFVALSKDAEDRMQVRVEELYDMFVGIVARNRGMDEQKIRDTKALTYGATQSVSIGLADNIASFEDALSAFTADTETETIVNGDDLMANDPTKKITMTEAEVETLKSESYASGEAAGIATGSANGETAAKTRITEIMSSPEGVARPKAAHAFAMKHSMPSADAIAMLGDIAEEAAVVPKTETPAPKTNAQGDQFSEFMKTNNPDLGANEDGANGEQAEVLQGAEFAKSFGIAGFV